MTCIVGIEHKGNVWMGADSIIAEGWNSSSTAFPKIFEIDNRFLVGISGLYRMMQIIEYSLKIDQQKDGVADHEFMVTEFVAKLKELLELHDNGKNLINESTDGGNGSMLVGYNGKLYSIDNVFAITRTTNNYEAIGGGGDFALGSLFTTKSCEMTPKAKILKALKSACHHSMNVRKPYIVKKLKG